MVAARRTRKAPVKKKVTSQFIALSELKEPKNILIYGDSGVGKTVWACSDDNVGIIAVENGTESALRQDSSAQVWPVSTWKDLEDVYTYLNDNPDHGFKWIVLDSLTQMQQLALRAILDQAVKENGARDLDIPAIQDHQKWQNMFKRFVLAFCDLDVNVIFTALSLKAEDEEGEPFLTPDLAGKGYQISQWVCGQMSSYGYMKAINKPIKDGETGEVKKDSNGTVRRKVSRRITWTNTGVIRGKDRFDVLAPHTYDLSLKEISEMIDAGPKARVTAATNRTAASARRGTRRRKTT